MIDENKPKEQEELLFGTEPHEPEDYDRLAYELFRENRSLLCKIETFKTTIEWQRQVIRELKEKLAKAEGGEE